MENISYIFGKIEKVKREQIKNLNKNENKNSSGNKFIGGLE